MGERTLWPTRAKCSGRLLCAMAKSRPISGELLRLLSHHLIHNCLICTDSVHTLGCDARKAGLDLGRRAIPHGSCPALDIQRNRSDRFSSVPPAQDDWGALAYG
jgi:hypothetical protein